jgi:2-C-methyl-D-erythritol 4-phosphate cytidylyltransferase
MQIPVLLIVTTLLVTGCTQGQESFSTEPGKGFGWKHMSATSEAIHQQPNHHELDQAPLVFPSARPLTTNNALQTGVARTPEQYLKIWFAPYQDAAGNLHEESVVHTVMQTGQWMVPTVKPNIAA